MIVLMSKLIYEMGLLYFIFSILFNKFFLIYVIYKNVCDCLLCWVIKINVISFIYVLGNVIKMVFLW